MVLADRIGYPTLRFRLNIQKVASLSHGFVPLLVTSVCTYSACFAVGLAAWPIMAENYLERFLTRNFAIDS